MDSHGNRDDGAHFFQRLVALHATTKNAPTAPNDGIRAFEFIQDDLEFNDALSHPDTRILTPRRLKVYFSSLHPNEWVFEQDADVTSPNHHMALCCTAAGTDSLTRDTAHSRSPLEGGETLVLLFRSLRGSRGLEFGRALPRYQQAGIVGVFLAFCAFVRAPFATIRLLYDMEMDFQRRLQEEATLMRNLRH